MTTPIGSDVRKHLEAMWDPVVDLLFVRVCLRIGLTDTLGDDFRIAFLVTCVFAVCALHPRRVLQKFPTEGATHYVVELLLYELVAV